MVGISAVDRAEADPAVHEIINAQQNARLMHRQAVQVTWQMLPVAVSVMKIHTITKANQCSPAYDNECFP